MASLAAISLALGGLHAYNIYSLSTCEPIKDSFTRNYFVSAFNLISILLGVYSFYTLIRGYGFIEKNNKNEYFEKNSNLYLIAIIFQCFAAIVDNSVIIGSDCVTDTHKSMSNGILGASITLLIIAALLFWRQSESKKEKPINLEESAFTKEEFISILGRQNLIDFIGNEDCKDKYDQAMWIAFNKFAEEQKRNADSSIVGGFITSIRDGFNNAVNKTACEISNFWDQQVTQRQQRFGDWIKSWGEWIQPESKQQETQEVQNNQTNQNMNYKHFSNYNLPRKKRKLNYKKKKKKYRY